MLSTMRLMLFFDGRNPKYALPVLAEYIRPNVYSRKSNSPSGTLQIRVFSSLTVSLSFPMISRSRCIRAQDHETVGVGHDREPRLRCARFACVHAVATTPAQRLGVLIRSFTPQPYLPSPKGLSGRPDRPFLRGLLV